MSRYAQSAASNNQQMYIMQVYSVLAFLSFAVFGCLHIFVEKNSLVGYSELGGAAAVLLTALLLKASNSAALARACLLLTIITLLAVMLLTGGTSGTGVFWFFMFPVAAFFLSGTREGLYWMGLLFATIVLIWASSYSGHMAMYYNGIEVRQLSVTLVVVSTGLYAYERYRERYASQALKSRKELDENIGQMAEMHAEVDTAKSEFVTLASHQLRTPISAIKWSSEVLLSGDAGDLNDSQREYLQGIEDSNKRLAAIVDNMLLVSNLDMDKLDIQAEPTDLPALSKKVLALEATKLSGKKLDVQEVYESGLPRVRVDQKMMSTILQNIFSNAMKYTPEGGTVRVAIKHDVQKVREDSKGSVLIEVADSGYGIPISQQKTVFDKMFRGANIKSKDTDGTGLGLYMVKALLERVGGRVWFESAENKGATFWVLLPLEGMSGSETGHNTKGEHV